MTGSERIFEEYLLGSSLRVDKALGGNAPKSWDRIKAVIDGDA